MGRRSEFPKLICEGATTLRIYRVVAKSSKNGSAYIVRWSLRTGKEDKSFVSLQKAIEFAKGKARDLSLARDEGSSLTRDESQEYILAMGLS